MRINPIANHNFARPIVKSNTNFKGSSLGGGVVKVAEAVATTAGVSAGTVLATTAAVAGAGLALASVVGDEVCKDMTPREKESFVNDLAYQNLMYL